MLILSFDGGGVRGIVSATLALHLEAAAQLKAHDSAPLNARANLLAGSSTGAILACGLAIDLSTARAIELYEGLARRVFPGRLSRIGWRLRALPRLGPSAPKYDPAPLEHALRDVFGDLTLGMLRHLHVVVPAYDLRTRLPYVFQSWLPEHADVPLWEVCRASSAAQTFFPSHRMTVDGRELDLIDGGNVANNPTVMAIAAAVGQGHKLSDLRAISFGTGKPDGGITGGNERGLLEWARANAGVMLSGPSEAAHHEAQAFLGDRYARLQVELPPSLQRMDDPGALSRLRSLARMAMRSGAVDLATAAELA